MPTRPKKSFACSVSVRVKPKFDDSAESTDVRFPGGAVFGPEEDQGAVYESLGMPSLIDSFMGGYDITVLAYGQTGCGKTHTIFGPPQYLGETHGHQEWGMFPRTMQTVLNRIQGTPATLTLSSVELYFGGCFDLLNKRNPVGISGGDSGPVTCDRFKFGTLTDEGRAKAKQRERAKRQKSSDTLLEISGQMEVSVQSIEDVIRVAKTVEATRSTKGHSLNHRSSRSHCVVFAVLTQPTAAGQVMTSKFLFVDLAGSERIKRSNSTGVKAKEAMSINTSLVVLNRVVQALGKHSKFIPYRDSPLTRVLKNGLGGNSRTAFLIAVDEHCRNAEETRCSLEFGSRCLMVKSKKGARRVREVGASSELLKAKLEEAEGALSLLKVQGRGGGLDMSVGVAQASRDAFISNRKRYLRFKRLAEETQAQIDYVGTTPELELTLFKANKEVTVQCGILARMQFSGLWTPPQRVYVQKQAEIDSLKAQIARLNGDTPPVVVNADLDYYALYKRLN
ncbi:kinesin-like protein [Kipferlia bialata]|uniref:Kinesin-like protein n=1 Tax=Kipferlia bialata TaxID=797122 RepID=A0A9K3CSG1_9EUKA|nr:kinesin-like protein [Kipferlia bialata]|eukprot:g1740.t1